MERTQPRRDASQELGSQIGIPVIMKHGTERLGILSNRNIFPRFSVTTAEEGRAGTAPRGVLVLSSSDRKGESRVALA